MQIIHKNPEYLPLANREALQERAEHVEKVEKLNDRELTQVAIKLLQALKS